MSGTMASTARTERIRGRRGVELRRRILAGNPLCAACEAKGRVTVATAVDHIVPLSKGGSNDEANLRPLCRDCHADKTRADAGHQPKPTYGADGWPV
jgi:5-methylcytosine-specific restriction protein A